jgi:hypothetical protein
MTRGVELLEVLAKRAGSVTQRATALAKKVVPVGLELAMRRASSAQVFRFYCSLLQAPFLPHSAPFQLNNSRHKSHES